MHRPHPLKLVAHVEDVERLARALWETSPAGMAAMPEEWFKHEESTRESFRLQARAMIEWLKEH